MTVSIEAGDWDTLRSEAAVIRYGVFVIEQDVPEDLDLDLHDADSRHWIARSPEGEALGTARLTPDYHVGRMAVLPEWRGRGVGGALLQAIQQHARDHGIRELELNAQVQAIPFYEKFGFTVEGPEFDDAGLPHRVMRWRAD